MFTNTVQTPSDLARWLTCALLLLSAGACPQIAEAATTTASKDCSTSPCTVVEAQFQILVAQTIQWTATYTGTATQGHSFYLSTVASNLADIPLTTSGQASGTQFLTPATYHISIRLALMGPGTYSVTYNPSSTGEPHLTTINGEHYDFQGAGEFILLRNRGGMEIQARQMPVATTWAPGADPHDSLAMCVALNSAVAARVGRHRVTYEPNLSGEPDPTGLQLRIDGVLKTIGPNGFNLAGGGRVRETAAPGGLRIDFPDKSALLVTPGWWSIQRVWYVDLDMIPRPGSVGLAGEIARNTWLPALPDGTSMGPMPSAMHDRYVSLYQKFADAWRVTKQTSLFDYAPNTSTESFTMHNFPPEQPPCEVPGTTPVKPATEKDAQEACQLVRGETAHANCVFDVRVTGNPGFATTYLLSQNPKTKPRYPPKN